MINKEHTFGYNNKHYYVSDLIEFIKDKKVTQMKVDDFKQTLMNDEANFMWGKLTDKNTILPLTMWSLLAHIDKINKADLKYPIIVTKYNLKHFTATVQSNATTLSNMYPKILDGYHRLMKAFLIGQKLIKVILLTEIDMQEFISKYNEKIT
jgi:hypothetical protein